MGEGAAFSERLEYLFRTMPNAQGVRYTADEIARRANDLGYPISAVYVSQLRSGLKQNPSLKHAAGLAAAFDVDIRFFTDDEAWQRGREEIEYLRLATAPGIEALAFRAMDLSKQSLASLIDYLKFLRVQEGLPADPPDLPEPRQ
ncbi:helix-turn-helix transcriptional regulator [Nocardia huaxiensis]|uniref:Helix-turn-helix transcriptional regulator n=1 Tax=Nocardia huaxiensis TaxID=2755382 RepID=A0A7D6ZD58_9NOCA|nr:helix-turn-helix transcriptional regulator [Nocardia huaxiensis]QLY28079.1 helix-turn-helix transcriptional regulator [Nocardia huaxiensis]UFS98484.1 XRE family transcriptional regulator [Nocardia huaxiensis]